MATIRKRGKGCQIDYFDPTGKRVRKSFKKKKDAEVEIGKRVSLISEGLQLDIKKEYNTKYRHERGEILGLKWSQIRNGFIYLDKTKTNEARQIPANDSLESLFRQIRKENGFMSKHVFLYDSQVIEAKTGKVKKAKKGKAKPITEIKKAFNSALKRANIVDFRFHDLRHTFASQLIIKGGTLKDVQELLGHKTMTMTFRYAHLTQEHKKKAVNLLNGLTASTRDKGMCHKTFTIPEPPFSASL